MKVFAMRRFLFTLLLAFVSFPYSGNAVAQAAPPDDSVYQAFGQKAGIRALMEDFFDRLKADARTAPFFKDTNRANLVDQLTDQLCQQAGGPCVYGGAKMGPAHRDLDIRKQDFNALVEVLQRSMDAKGIPFAAQNRMLARLAPMHRDIVTR
jgi:hemoglobin